MKSSNNILSIDAINECTSCQFCESICPVNAIIFSLNEEGFYRPKVSNVCIECGICKKYCYKFQNITINEDILSNIECYSAKSKNINILKTSASGGISTILFENLLAKNYKIVGVSFNTRKNIAETIIIEKIEDLELLKGSKYMQSRSDNIFRKITKSKDKFAIIGTPCSIYPISIWAKEKKQQNRFIFIDFFCHGTPTILLWKKYSEFYFKNNNIENVKFRSKHYGWHEFCHEFITDEQIIYSSITEKDPFFTMFFDNHFLNNSCYKCKSRDSFEYCDIRLGDYWGSKFDDDIEGVSVVILVTEKGKKVFNSIKEKLVYEIEDFNEIINLQAYKKTYSFDADIRFKYIKKFKTKEDIFLIFNTYLKKYSFCKKMKRYCKIFIKKLPSKLVRVIRTKYHRES